MFGETIKQTHLKEKERSIYLENYVEEFELFASDQGFVSRFASFVSLIISI